MCGECGGKRGIQCHDKCEAMYFHKAGSLSVSCKSCKICLWEENLSSCQAYVVCLTLMCKIDSNLCAGNFKFCQNRKIFASAGQGIFLQ